MTKCAIGIKSIHLLIRSDSPASPVIPRHRANPSNAGINEARKTLASRGKISMLQPETGLVALGRSRPATPEGPRISGKTALKVIASSIRKGNVIEQDGKLYVVLSAENIHPGKGTPVSQIEMRRISDGVKISERYKTTDQVEKATIEDHNFNYLYEDADGFHFMNNDTLSLIHI